MEEANIANEMSDEVKRFTLKNVEDFLSDNELKNTKGGSFIYKNGCPSAEGSVCLQWDCYIESINPYYEFWGLCGINWLDPRQPCECMVD